MLKHAIIIAFMSMLVYPALGFTHGTAVPIADTKCTITTGICTGVGGGSSLFTAASCNGSADDVAAFNSFNTWATGTWQVAHPGLLLELDIPSGAICEFISGDVNHNKIGAGILRFQLVGYNATLSDHGGTGGGFFLGCQGLCGVQFNGTASTVRLANVSAGSTGITILDTSKCALFSAGNWALIGGIDPQGFGDPPNPQVFEWVTILSTASCAGAGAITLSNPLANSYKSTWPSYNVGDPGHSDQGGPATLYQLGGVWNINHAYYGITIDQQASQINANGMNITFRDISCSNVSSSCVIPSQNLNFNIANLYAPNSSQEFDKIVANINYSNVNLRQVKVQSAGQNWTCTNCTINNSLQGTGGITTFNGGTIASLQLGAIAYGVSGSFTGKNTVVSSAQLGGSSQDNIAVRGIWSSGTLTVPQNLSISSYANNGSGLIRLTVTSTAGWTNGIVGGGCGGTFPVTVIDTTHADLQGSTYSAGVCSGTASFGSLPLNWAVPRANVYFGAQQSPLGPILQVVDLNVGPNNSTVISFNLNGSPYSGGFPTLPGSGWKITAHPAPSWSCVGCTGVAAITDVNSASASGLPFGSYVSRIATSANNAGPFMFTFGQLTELDETVTSACSGASNLQFLSGPAFIQTLGSATLGTWGPTVNAFIASATPRIMTPTTTSGAQSGDSLVAPGTNTWILGGQISPQYSAVGNCGTASTTFTVKTNQGVVYP